MSALENPKTYTGADLETIFFRPMLSGPSAQELGVRILYNMPVPTTIQLWDGSRNILTKYTAAGWSGGAKAQKYQKTISLNKVKAEMSFAAADYFSMVYELIACRGDVNMDDLTGSELEQAETSLFKQAIAESIRATMWVGDASASNGYNTFNGFLKTIMNLSDSDKILTDSYSASTLEREDAAPSILEQAWMNADERVQDLKAEGQLAYFVTSDIYHLYEKYLDSKGADAAYAEFQQGRPSLSYHGIPVIDLRLSSYLKGNSSLPGSFCLLTDRRNLVLAVNTADFPGNEVRMWYNPDLMENRQRAVFMAGCDILDEKLISFSYKA